MGIRQVGKAGLELLSSGDPPALASQSARIYRHEPPCSAHAVFLKYGLREQSFHQRLKVTSIYLSLFFEVYFCSVAHAGVQWRDLGSL